MPAGRAALLVSIAAFCLLFAALALLIYGPDIATSEAFGFATLLAIPFAMGAIASAATDPHGIRSVTGCAFIPVGVLAGAALIVWLVSAEGAICIAMIIPLWLPAALGGFVVNLVLRRARIRHEGEDNEWRMHSVVWAALPALLFTTDLAAPPEWQSHEVMREILIDAPPEKIWPLLISIPDISQAEGRWTVTQDVLGVPRPSEARLVRRNGGLVRLAGWGEDIRFEEQVTAIVPGRAIAWRFAFPDDSVQRHTDRHVAPDGEMLRIESGRYELSHGGDGKTTLRLVTRYGSRVRLDGYFALWGDRMLGDVEANVLEIVRQRAEAQH